MVSACLAPVYYFQRNISGATPSKIPAKLYFDNQHLELTEHKKRFLIKIEKSRDSNEFIFS